MNLRLPLRLRLSSTCFASLVVLSPALALAAPLGPAACGDLRPPGQYGPFDYRTASSEVKHRVEDYHFDTKTESLKGGGTGIVGGDIDYTLRAFPNNPRALLAMSRLGTKYKSERPPGVRWIVECYFERAIRFTPDDPLAFLMYGNYLSDRGRNAEAKQVLDRAEALRGEPSSFDLDYNLGLLFFAVGETDKAAVAGRRAYALGAPFPGLKKKLVAAGKWKE